VGGRGKDVERERLGRVAGRAEERKREREGGERGRDREREGWERERESRRSVWEIEREGWERGGERERERDRQTDTVIRPAEADGNFLAMQARCVREEEREVGERGRAR